MKVLLCVLPGQGAQHVAQVVGRKVQGRRHPLHRQQAFFLRFALGKPGVHHRFKPGEQIALIVFSGNELPLVKAVGVGQQQINLRDNDVLCMPVNVPALLLNFVDEGHCIRFFCRRKVQCLVHGVGKETVLRDGFCQRVLQQQVGMKKQEQTRTAFQVCEIQGLHLPGGRKAHHAFVVIVQLLAVLDLALDVMLQSNAVKLADEPVPSTIGPVPAVLRTGHADQRMQRLRQGREPVKLRDGLNVGHAVKLQLVRSNGQSEINNRHPPSIIHHPLLVQQPHAEFVVPVAGINAQRYNVFEAFHFRVG